MKRKVKAVLSYMLTVALVVLMAFGSGNNWTEKQVQAINSDDILTGDVSGDGELTVSDVVKLRNLILVNQYSSVGDLNGDGVLDDTDVSKLRELIMNGYSIHYTSTPEISDGVYQISKVSELLWAADNPDKDYILIENIDLTSQDSWNPIGTAEKPFSGSFDGNGHYIKVAINESKEQSGIYEEGIFGYVTGDISNLTVNGTINVRLYSGYVGAIAANLAGGSIINCTNNATITAESANNVLHVGGIVGAARNVDNSVSMIDGAVNNGDIIVEAVTTGSSDAVLGDGTNGGAVGGILGFVVTASGVDVGRSINNGKITVTGGNDNIGGIIGQTSTNGTSATAYANITYCANKGAITVYKTEGERAAGIIGYVKGGRIEYCYNLADVIEYTDANGNTVARTGYGNYFGIFGYANLSSNNKLSVIYCYNASPSPLEAEICVVRNASYGTFKNFYMSGRTEYETELMSANVSAGTAGTAFDSADDLYSKLTATTEGANAYRSNGNGYPVLYFEQGTDTVGSVSIALTDMPNYIDGTASANVYDCGPGMMSDQNGATGEESHMVVVSSTNATSFERYAAKLINDGFEKEAKTEVENNIYYTFTKNDRIYYMYYTVNKGEARFIEDISSNVLTKDISTEKTGSNGTELYMYSIDYSEHEHTYSTTDHWCIDCGMMYIIKLADNSVFLIDSGHERQASQEAMAGLLDFLRNITGTSASEKIQIRGWFFSHAHGDHVFGAHQFVETYHDNINIESVLFNFPRYGVVGGYDSGTFKMKDTINKYFPNVKHISLHTGQTFTMQGVKFDTLCTHEDWVGTDGKTTLGSDMNTASTVLKITIDGKSLMLLGDITMSNRLEEMYTTTLKADMVQIAHHGYNDLPSLYTKIAAKYAVCPNSEANGQDNASKIQNVINAGATNVYYADKYTYKFVATASGFDVTTLDRYTVALGIDFDAPAFNTNDVSGQNASIADLNAMTSRTSVLDKLITKSVLGSAATSTAGSELPYRVFDGDTGTKWCTKSSGQQFYIKWKMTEPVTINGYALYTGNDTASNPGRNPVKWVLKGSNDGKNWTILDAVSNGNLPSTNYEGAAFNVKNPGRYQYYVMQFLEVKAYDTAKESYLLQLSEIKLYQ